MQNQVRSIRLFVSILVVLAGSVAYAQEDTTGTLIGQHNDDLSAIAVSGNGKLLASGSWDRSVHLYRIGSDSNINRIQSLQGHNAAVSAIGFSKDGEMVVTGGKDYKLIVWVSEEGSAFEKDKEMNMVHTAGINKVIVGPYKRMIYSAGDDGKIVVNNLARGSSRVIDHDKPINDIALSTNRQFIYCADQSAVVKQYDGIGNVIREMEGHKDVVNAVASSPDGKYLVTGSSDKSAIVWDAVTGKQKIVLGGHNWKVVSVDVSADSKYVITGCMDGTTKIWEISDDLSEGKELKSLSRSDGMIRQVVMSPDMRYVFIAHQIDPNIQTDTYGVVVWKSGLKFTLPQRQMDPRLRHHTRTRGGQERGKSNASPVNKPETGTSRPVTSPTTKENQPKKPVKDKGEVISEDDGIKITIEDE